MLQLRRRLRQVAGPCFGSVVSFISSEDLLSDFVLLAPSFYKFASYSLVDGRMPMAWPHNYSAALYLNNALCLPPSCSWCYL
jgi:hypothetical protein